MGKYLKLGVMVPMKNHTFMKGTAFDTTCTAADISRGAVSAICLSQTPSLLASLNKGDFIKLGVSTNDTNLRATEELMVSKTTSDDASITNINFDSSNSALFAYDRPDRVSGVGNYFPDNWTAPTATVINAFDGDVYYIPKLDGLNLPDYSDVVSGTDKSNLESFTTYGVDDYYCSKIALFKAAGWSSADLDILRYTFGVGDILTSTYYRAGVFYRYKVYNNTGYQPILGTITFNDGNSSLIGEYYFGKNFDYEETEWLLHVSSPVQTNSSLTTAGYINFNILFIAGSPSKLLHNLDCVWVEHAKWTDDDTKGVYTFTEHPAIGSQNWNFTEFRQKSKTASGEMRYGQKDGRKRARYEFSCRFEDVSSDFWKNLLILQQWGKLGYKLVFHTSEVFDSRVPPILVGRVILKNIQKNSWSTDLKSFTFSFIESE